MFMSKKMEILQNYLQILFSRVGSSKVIVVRYCSKTTILKKEAVVIANYVLFKSSHVIDYVLTATRLFATFLNC